MKLVLTRDMISNVACTGVLDVYDDEGNKIFHCYTLEEDTVATLKNKDGTYVGGRDERIPPGIYNLRRHDAKDSNGRLVSRYASKIKKWTGVDSGPINVFNDEVPASRLILIHWGNYDKDTEGCILLGNGRQGANMITDSQNCCSKFYNIMKDVDLSKCKLEIIRKF